MTAEMVHGPEDYERPSIAYALVLTFLAVAGGLAFVVIVSTLGDAIGGALLAIAGALAGEIAVLTFLTIRAYPPQTKAPMLRLLLATILLSLVLPLIYLSWLWVTKKKWRDAAIQARLVGSSQSSVS